MKNQIERDESVRALDREVRARVAAEAAEHGEYETALRYGVSRHTLARAIAGFALQRHTRRTFERGDLVAAEAERATG